MTLPVIWMAAAITSYFHPGDEYGLFVVSTIAGSWTCFLIRNIGHLRDVLWIILLTGGLVMAAFGFLLDRLRVSRRVWAGLFGLCFIGMLVWALSQYPSLERAIGKNGSLTAYAAGAINMGLYLSIVLALFVKGIKAAAKKNDRSSS
jgi:hypothetical protein